MESGHRIEESADYFGALYPYVCNDNITDIDYNGEELWLTDCRNMRKQIELPKVTGDFVNQFTNRVANTVSKPFNKQHPILEAETKCLRITVVHESVAITGRSFCIRKSLPYVRMTAFNMLQEQYCSQETLQLLQNCVRQKKNIVFCGEPGVGKTECAKFFSGYIDPKDRVITIEDNPEWHYREMYPGRDSIALRISEQMDYTSAIKTCLRLNPKWMMLSEARSTEVAYLMEGFSTGVKGFTTLHTDDVRKVPDRIINMSSGEGNQLRLENDIYTFIDVAVLICRKMIRTRDNREIGQRYIDQVCFFHRRNGQNEIEMMVEGGVYCGNKTAVG